MGRGGVSDRPHVTLHRLIFPIQQSQQDSPVTFFLKATVSSAGGIEGWELELCHIGYSGHPELSLEMGILEDTGNTTQDGHH